MNKQQPLPWDNPRFRNWIAVVRAEKAVVREVAAALGNTPTVCRKSYIDPVVFAGWRAGRLQKVAVKCRGERQWESAALRFLRKAHARR